MKTKVAYLPPVKLYVSCRVSRQQVWIKIKIKFQKQANPNRYAKISQTGIRQSKQKPNYTALQSMNEIESF